MRGRLRATTLTTAVVASLLAVQPAALGCVTALEVSNLKLAGAELAMPASAGTTQVSGIGVFNTECQAPVGSPPADPGDYPPIDLSGSLNGCWYTYVSASQFNPSGTYLEQGTEIFVGCLNGLACGTFETIYTFTAKYVDDTFAEEIHGRCEHSDRGWHRGLRGGERRDPLQGRRRQPQVRLQGAHQPLEMMH